MLFNSLRQSKLGEITLGTDSLHTPETRFLIHKQKLEISSEAFSKKQTQNKTFFFSFFYDFACLCCSTFSTFYINPGVEPFLPPFSFISLQKASRVTYIVLDIPERICYKIWQNWLTLSYNILPP